ncbi:unnamed protein product [Rhodiola kirilowii]
MEEAVAERLKPAELIKQELMRSLEALTAQSSSLFQVSVRWKVIESYFDSVFQMIQGKCEEEVTAIRVREEAVEKKEERVGDLRSGIFGEIFEKRERLVDMERELEEREKRVELAEKVVEEKERGVEEREMRMEEERRRFLKELDDRKNVVEWRGKRLDQRKKLIDAKVKEVDVRELEIEEQKKAVERRCVELVKKEEELLEMKRAMDDLCEELKAKRSENVALREEVLLLTQKLEFAAKSSGLSGTSREEESLAKIKFPVRAEQVSSAHDLHRSSQLDEAQSPCIREAAEILEADCLSIPNVADVREVECQFTLNAAETCSMDNSIRVSVHKPLEDADVNYLGEDNEDILPFTSNAAEPRVVECPRPSIAADMSGVDTTLDGKTLQIYLNDKSSSDESWQDEIETILRRLSDPAKTVLDAIQGFYPPHLNVNGKQFGATIVRKTCICLLRKLNNLSPTVNAAVRDEALKLAFEWKDKMAVTAENPLEVTGFLELVLTYGLTKEFDGFELLNMSKIASPESPPLKLLQGLGCVDSISHSETEPYHTNSEVKNRKTSDIGYVTTLIRMNQRHKALEYVCEFNLEDNFPISNMVDIHANYLRQTSRILLEESGMTTAAQKEAVDVEIAGLKDLIMCIESHGLQDRYSPVGLRERIAQLEKQHYSKKRVAACLNPDPRKDPCTNARPLKKERVHAPGYF